MPAARPLWPLSSGGRRSVFDGMQPQLVHSPPISSCSTSASFLPALSSVLTATSPAGPAPSTTTSNRWLISSSDLQAPTWRDSRTLAGLCYRCGTLARVATPDEREELELVQALRQGEEAAFRALVDRYHAS